MPLFRLSFAVNCTAPMSRTFSIYLDALRFVAALMVFLAHASQPHLGAIPLGVLGQFGHNAVVVFFVLSGFVICHAVHHRDREIESFIINRLARLWSVAVPALLLTLVLDTLGGIIAPERYMKFASEAPVTALISNLFFINQLWFLDLSPLSNSPFWSLGFEAWYYIFFAAAYFLRGWIRIAATGLALGAMGPKILIMLPVWLCGAALYRTRPTPSGRLGAALFFGAVAVYLLYRWSNVSQPLSRGLLGLLPELHFGMAAYFPSDYFVALLVAANFIGFQMMEHRLASVFATVEKSVRFAASFTFSLYLFHFPLLLFAGAFLAKGSYLSLPIVLAVTAALGSVCEKRKGPVRSVLWRLLEIAAERAGHRQRLRSGAGEAGRVRALPTVNGGRRVKRGPASPSTACKTGRSL